jgi:hypothetical protein
MYPNSGLNPLDTVRLSVEFGGILEHPQWSAFSSLQALRQQFRGRCQVGGGERFMADSRL